LGTVVPMWRVLGTFGWWVLIFGKCGRDVSGHGHVACSSNVVPLKRDATVEAGIPIDSDVFVVGSKEIDEMIGVVATGVLYPEIVHDEGEHGLSSLVLPQSGSVAALEVSMGLETLFKELVGQDASLGKAIHAFGNLDVDVVVVDQLHEVVFVNDLLGNETDVNPHVFCLFHGSVEVEILDIETHRFGATVGTNSIGETFESSDVRRWSAGAVWVLDEIAAYGEPGTFDLRLLETLAADETRICGDLVARYRVFGNEKDGVGAFDTAPNTLGQTAKFVRTGV
jgi:hypothetical protein